MFYRVTDERKRYLPLECLLLLAFMICSTIILLPITKRIATLAGSDVGGDIEPCSCLDWIALATSRNAHLAPELTSLLEIKACWGVESRDRSYVLPFPPARTGGAGGAKPSAAVGRSANKSLRWSIAGRRCPLTLDTPWTRELPRACRQLQWRVVPCFLYSGLVVFISWCNWYQILETVHR